MKDKLRIGFRQGQRCGGHETSVQFHGLAQRMQPSRFFQMHTILGQFFQEQARLPDADLFAHSYTPLAINFAVHSWSAE